MVTLRVLGLGGMLFFLSAAATAAPVTGILGIYGLSSEHSQPVVGVNFQPDTAGALVAEDDLSFLIDTNIQVSSFTLENAIGITLLSANGFSFEVSSIELSDQGNANFWDFQGTGIIYLDGFEPTEAVWRYSSPENAQTYTLSVTAVPIPATGSLALMAFASLLALKTRKKS